jgi:hypothetical protein
MPCCHKQKLEREKREEVEERGCGKEGWARGWIWW